MTDPSPDCGYTDAGQAEALTVNVRAFINSWSHHHGCAIFADPEWANTAPCDCGREAALATLDSLTAFASADQAHEEIARLREFGEHYSGAAQDAWDRIEVLEKALREIASLPEQSEDWHEYDVAVVIAREALAAGSASPGGDETATHGRHCPCTGCANEDWTRADLAPCGTHGADCPNVYAPAAAPVSTETAP